MRINKDKYETILKVSTAREKENLITKIDEVINVLQLTRIALIKSDLYRDPPPINGNGILRHLGPELEALAISYYQKRIHTRSIIDEVE